MFVLAIVEDKIKIAPEKFDQDNTDMILEEIDQKFINKVSLYWYVLHFTSLSLSPSCLPHGISPVYAYTGIDRCGALHRFLRPAGGGRSVHLSCRRFITPKSEI
jgi:hypothetical protein